MLNINYDEFLVSLTEAIDASIGSDDQTEEYVHTIEAIDNIVDDFYGEFIGNDDDVVVVELPAENVDDFINKIDETANVMGYDVSDDEADDKRQYVTLYIDPSIVMFSSDLDDDAELSEATIVTKFNSRNIRRKKYLCQPGFKHSSTTGACEKIGGMEKMDRRIGMRHAILTKKRGGAALKLRIIRKTRKAMKYRKAAGF
jgi:hypothetical protein